MTMLPDMICIPHGILACRLCEKRETITTVKQLAESIKRGEKWRLVEPVEELAATNIGCLGMPVNTPVTSPQRTAEPVQEPVAIVGIQEDVWKGYDGKWAPPGPPINTVFMLRDLPVGTPLYTAPPPAQAADR